MPDFTNLPKVLYCFDRYGHGSPISTVTILKETKHTISYQRKGERSSSTCRKGGKYSIEPLFDTWEEARIAMIQRVAERRQGFLASAENAAQELVALYEMQPPEDAP